MMRGYFSLVVTLLLIFAVVAMGLHHSERVYNQNRLPTLEEVHKSTTDALLGNIKVENIKKYLRMFTRNPTSPEQKQTEMSHMPLQVPGLQPVLMFYEPNTLVIATTEGKKVFHSTGVSPVILPEEQSGKHAGHQWLAWAGNGSVTGDVVFCNRGTDTDFKNLIIMGVPVKGRIALIRYGEGFRADKVYRAQKYGAIGAILYSDTADVAPQGTNAENVYPNTIWMPNESVQRGTLMHGDGDPLSPYYPSKENLFRSRTIEEAMEDGMIPKIPVLPISYTTAYQVLKRMKGRVVPASWQGTVGRNVTYRLGPGLDRNEKLTINVRSELTTKTIQNVIGYIRGVQEPDRYVMLGNHFDAWVYGSMDPNSGTAVLAEVARAMMQTVNETTWKPARTIVFTAWDAEEYGLIGSTEFVEEFVDILQKRAVVYINMDTLVANESIAVQTVPMLEHIAIDVAKRIPNPSAKDRREGKGSVYDTWLATFPSVKGDSPIITIPGGGSDQSPFLNYAGVPVVNFEFTSRQTMDSYPLYHTLYETPFTNEHLIDVDNMAVHKATGQYWAELARTFADEPILPINATHLGNALLRVYLPKLKILLASINATKAEAEPVRQQFKNIVLSAQALMQMARKFEATVQFTKHSFAQNPYDQKDITAINERLMSSERCFINPRGVSEGNRAVRHVLFSVSTSDSYSNALMAGVSNAIDAYHEKPSKKAIREIANQVSIVQYSINCVVNNLRDVI